MNIRKTLFAASFLAICSPGIAGAFVDLPTTDPLRVVGVNNPNADPLYLGDAWTPDSAGYSQAARRISSVLYDGVDVGTFYDYVYRSDSDGTLLFASRFVLEVEEVGDYTVEINDIFRRGFDGYDVAVGWYDPDSGSRLVSAALSDIGRTRPQLPDVFNPDQVDLRTDVSIEEDNPSTAWYVIKTNATEFAYLADAVGVYQAASTDGMDPPLRLANFEGLAPVAAIPEPGEYAMMLVGLVAIGVMVKRRNKRVAA